MKALAVLLAGVLLVAPSRAIVDRVIEWQAVQVRAVLDGEPVTVLARLEDTKLAYLAVRFRSHSAIVPVDELVGVPEVSLRTLRVVSPDHRRYEGLNIRVEFELVPLPAFEQHGVAAFHFGGGVYRGRFVERVVDGKFANREFKEVGQPPRPESR